MFGFLKQKLADFGNKLKQTISKEEKETEEKPKEEIKQKEILIQKKETPKTEGKKIETKKEPSETKKEDLKQKNKDEKETKKETAKTEPKKEEKTKEKEVKTEEKKKEPEKPKQKEENKTETKKETAVSKEEPKQKGLLSKIFGIGKKEETKKEVLRKEEANTIEPIKEKQTEKPKQKEETLQKEIQLEKEDKIIEEIKSNIIKETPKIETKEEIEESVEEASEELIEEEISREKPRNMHIATIEEEKRELKANIGIGGGLKGMFFGGVEISEKQIEDLLFELELSLIESDVEQDAALELVNQIKQRLVGKKVSAKNIDEYLKEQIKEILTEMMKTSKINVLEDAKEAKKNGEVYKILILGPNGAGKTTTIAKLVKYFQKNKLSCILAAGDTFRAGAIDQIEIHAKNLKVRVIKHQYGADPAAIAFDAISAAKAGKIDVVLIDSAGRQETNKNLMEELKKLERVAKPNLKLFIGESYVGQGLLDQVDEFEKIIGIDGYILTKLDTDAKGGTAISLAYKTKKPIIFIGTGQGYDDFEEFSSEYILNRII
jgi:fused signal recognition particle receptor